jgi:hypothetical protein
MTVRDSAVPARVLNLPQAARFQREVTAADLALADYARLRRPRVLWWWGQASLEGRKVALCYLCDQPIATWDMRHPITLHAQLALEAHRKGHADGELVSIGTVTPAMIAGDEAPPTGGQE